MTDEQIKQNAYGYLANLDRSGVLLTGNEVYLAFIAGAHSRDEEVKHIEEKYVFCRKKMIKFNNELNKPRNPRISVENINTHESYVSLETAKLLKQAEFDWEVNHYYFMQNSKTEAKSDFRHPAQNYNEDMATMDSKSFEFEVCSRPTLDVAQRWLREVKGVEVYAHVFYDTYDMSEGWDVYVYEVNHIAKQTEDWINSYDVYHTYEEAQEAGIKRALEKILEKGE